MSEEAMRKHYERTPKETLIDILVASREQVEKLQKRNKKLKKRIDKALEILSKINYEDKNEYIPPLEILPVYKILLGVDKE